MRWPRVKVIYDKNSSPVIGYLRREEYSVDQLARIIADRTGAVYERHREPREVSGVAGEMVQLGLPRLPPVGFNP